MGGVFDVCRTYFFGVLFYPDKQSKKQPIIGSGIFSGHSGQAVNLHVLCAGLFGQKPRKPRAFLSLLFLFIFIKYGL
ncbi:MAG: hypothetical protein V5804_04865 [Mucilaginibacter sp.]|uniref:hypothetical protein n=1 Tax=Mucilaginibacter sp. TaxID=1882438 RepID=UPI0034E3EB02